MTRGLTSQFFTFMENREHYSLAYCYFGPHLEQSVEWLYSTLKFRDWVHDCDKWTDRQIDKRTDHAMIITITIISSMFVPICNHFHVRQANNGRITPF